MPSELATLAVDVSREAGQLLRQAFGRAGAVDRKHRFDVVTDADREADQAIVRRLRTARPGDRIVAEESGDHEGRGGLCWYVDPLDGTKNFARGYPAFAVSVAVVDDDGPLVGVVFDPLRDELFAAERGQGATCNGRPLAAAPTLHLDGCLVATGFPSASRHPSPAIAPFIAMSMCTQGVRRSGSSALDLAYVAAGRIDAFWDLGLRPWDLAAGTLIVAEAGGRVSTIAGSDFTLGGPDVLACAAGVHQAFVRLLSGPHA